MKAIAQYIALLATITLLLTAFEVAAVQVGAVLVQGHGRAA